MKRKNFLLNNKKSDGEVYIHISFDDTIIVFQDLTNNAEVYNSIFDNDTLAFLKKMNDRYGAVFSMYCFYENSDGSFNLSECTDAFAEEFAKNASWLKFGFHNINGNGNLADASEKQALEDYEKVVFELNRICGGSIDHVVRLQNFAGNRDAILAMKESTDGIVGLFTADDDRISYYLDADANSYIMNHDSMWDYENEIYFISTDLRLEKTWIPYADLVKIAKDSNQNQIIEVFSHEWMFSDTLHAMFTRWKIQLTCIFAKNYGYTWYFPESKLLPIFHK